MIKYKEYSVVKQTKCFYKENYEGKVFISKIKDEYFNIDKFLKGVC